jgi:hypothetical protein
LRGNRITLARSLVREVALAIDTACIVIDIVLTGVGGKSPC